MNEDSKTHKLIKSLPTFPLEGWPRHSPHKGTLEWVFRGETFGILYVSTLMVAESKGKDPQLVINDFLTFMRNEYH